MCNCSVLSNCNCNAAHACIVICLFGWNMCNDETSTKSTTTKKYKRTQIAKCNAVKNSSHAGLSIWDAIHICLLNSNEKRTQIAKRKTALMLAHPSCLPEMTHNWNVSSALEKSWEGGEREDENKKFKSGDARKVRGERRLMMRMGERVRRKTGWK